MQFHFGIQEDMKFNVAVGYVQPGGGSGSGIQGDGIANIRTMTESEYAELESYVSTTLYIVKKEDGTMLMYLGSVPLRINDDTLVHSNNTVNYIEQMTETEYAKIGTPDEKTLYVLT